MSTLKDPGPSDGGAAPAPPPLPGLLLCFSCGVPRFEPLPLRRGALEIGRDELIAFGVDDPRVSRRHLAFERRERWKVRDLGSTNGSFLDGAPLTAPRSERSPRVARMGRTLLLFFEDVLPLQSGLRVSGDMVMGPSLFAVRERVARFAEADQHVLLSGESGVGKELLARAYHEASARPRGPFVAVNCAAVPKELAERLFFGSTRGAFSGAIDSVGFFQAADGGTLFLDEIGELEPGLQSKLLRALETREVVPLGSTRPQPVDIRLCAATLRDLRGEVTRGAFREDLYFRVGRPEVRVPPLRDRPEEIPTLIERAVRSVAGAKVLAIRTALVETCLLRPWPGNVRELWFEVRSAALEAIAAGRVAVEAADLDEEAGRPIEVEVEPAIDVVSLREAMAAERGNVSRAAERLGVPRTNLRRLIALYGIDAAAYRAGGEGA